MGRGTLGLSDVAKLAQVSKSTASRVLTGSRAGGFSVTEAVRLKVRQAADQLGYSPNLAARSLAAGKTRLVGVVGRGTLLSDRVGPGERALEALAEQLDLSGYDLAMHLHSSRHSPFHPPRLRVDGVVAIGADDSEDLLALEASGVPYVSLNGAAAGGACGCVVPDDAGGTRLAVEHLLERGHRRLAYLDHPAAGAKHPSVLDRREAFARAAQEPGFEWVKVEPPNLGPAEPWDGYYRPFLHQAVTRGGATAVLAYSHHGALGLIRTAHEQGLSVPGDLAVICFNDEPVLKVTIPSVTAIELPSAEMGRIAARMLLGLMRPQADAPVSRRVRLRERLIVRESTAVGRP